MSAEGKKRFIVGATDLAQLLLANLRETGAPAVEAFAVDSQFRTSSTFMGLPLLDLQSLPQELPPEEYACHVCLGYSRMNEPRRKMYERLGGMGYSILGFQHPLARVLAERQGVGNLFFANVLVDYFTVIGSGNIFYPGSSLAHHSSMGDFNFAAVNACIAGHTRLGDNNFIGANATVINGLTLADHCLVGAGACLDGDLPANAVYVPARGRVLAGRQSSEFL